MNLFSDIESEEKWRQPFLKAGRIFSILGGLLLALSALDARFLHLIPGADNPLSGNGGGSVRHILKGLKSLPPEGVEWNQMTTLQKITAAGLGTSFIGVMFGNIKFMRASSTLTLGALATYEVIKTLTTGKISLSRLVFFLGAALSMSGVGLDQAFRKPKPVSQQAKEAIGKAKSIVDRFRPKKKASL